MILYKKYVKENMFFVRWDDKYNYNIYYEVWIKYYMFIFFGVCRKELIYDEKLRIVVKI